MRVCSDARIVERAAVKIPVGDCMCLAGARGRPRQASKSLSLGKRLKSGCWWPGSLIETAQDGRPKPVGAGRAWHIGTVHPCQAPGQFASSPDWIPVYRDPPAPERPSSSGPARYYEPIRLCSARDKNQFHNVWAIRRRDVYLWSVRSNDLLLVYVRITFTSLKLQLPEPRTVRLLNQRTIPVELSL